VGSEMCIRDSTGGVPRAVQWQGAQLCLWVEVSSEATPVPREFAIYGTGHPMPAYPGSYVGTFQMEGGSLVFHLYDAGST
jgi:hypothetical protein